MPMQIIDKSSDAARLKFAQNQALGKGVQEASFIVAQAINDYHNQQIAERDKKLSVMTTYLSKFGAAKMGPDFLHEYETMTGVPFPRDEKGQPMMTDEEAFQAKVKPIVDAHMDSPAGRESALAAAHLTSLPKPASEVTRENAVDAEKVRSNKRNEDIDAFKAQTQRMAVMAKASRPLGSARVQEMAMGSSFMKNPDDPLGMPIPYQEGKGVELTNRQFKNYVDRNKHVLNVDKLKLDETVKTIMNRTRVASEQNKQLGTWMRAAINKDGAFDEATSSAAKDAVIAGLQYTSGVDVKAYRSDPDFWKMLSFQSNEIASVPEQVQAVQDKLASQAPSAPGPAEHPNIAKFTDEQLTTNVTKWLSQNIPPEKILIDSGNSPRVKKILEGLKNAQPVR